MALPVPIPLTLTKRVIISVVLLVVGLGVCRFLVVLAVTIYTALKLLGRSLQMFVQGLEPWGIFIASAGLVVALFGFTVEMEDRQSERIFRAWQVVYQAARAPIAEGSPGNSETTRAVSDREQYTPTSVRQALEYLNRRFSGLWCDEAVGRLFLHLTGSSERMCVIPRKRRESFASLSLSSLNLSGADLAGADLRRTDLRATNLDKADLRDADLLVTAQGVRSTRRPRRQGEVRRWHR